MSTNAIMRRVERMNELWEQFAEHPAARLACWLLDHDSTRMFDLFLELQNEEASDIPDLFIRLGEPLEAPERHGLILRESLVLKYDEVREGLQAEGIAANWQCPPLRRNEDDVESLIGACASLHKTHESIARHVVIALLPQSVASADAWRDWLRKLLDKSIPEHVRFLVTDHSQAAQLTDLCPGEPERAMVLRPELTMGAAYLELLRELPGSGPAFLFRRFFVALGNAVGAGNLATARQLADHASRIAAQQQWPHLQTAVALMLGGGLLARSDYAGALECYRQGKAAVAQSSGDVEKKVALQAQFAEASALVAASRPAEAASVYEQIHAASLPLKDGFAQLEGARMAAYCHELTGNQNAAWQRNLDALAAGESLGSSAAKQSTVSFVGDSLVRLAGNRSVAERDAVLVRLDKLLGPSWQSTVQREMPR